MIKKKWGWWALIGSLLIILLLMIVTTPAKSQSKKPIRVVASLNFYGEAAQKVAGKYGQVESLINNSAVDPHDYQPSIRQSQQVSHADFIIENGLGYDHWMDKMVAANDNHPKVITVGTTIAHAKNGDNEHVWYQPQVMIKLTNQLTDEFAKKDPKHSDYYHENAKTYVHQLNQQDKLIRQAKANVHQNDQVAVSEPVFDYSLAAMGYHITDSHFAKAIEDGDDPSTHDISAIQNDIRHHRLAFFVENPQSSSKTVDNLTRLARKHHVTVIQVTETKPDDESYTEWMSRQYRLVLKAQRSE